MHRYYFVIISTVERNDTMKRLFSLLLITLVAISLSGCDKNEDVLPDDYLFDIIGDEVIYLDLGYLYIEKGFIAKYDFTDISE